MTIYAVNIEAKWGSGKGQMFTEAKWGSGKGQMFTLK
jgi:hypothetical protein